IRWLAAWPVRGASCGMGHMVVSISCLRKCLRGTRTGWHGMCWFNLGLGFWALKFFAGRRQVVFGA
uniref:Uncharacterized protein n=1 Tax=Aegilops tauschii subsp. strangulata TaxID=200361 RepID=A0A453M230_AEGTS